MRKSVFVIVLALALTLAFAASASATTGKFYAHSTSYYKWIGGAAAGTIDVLGDGTVNGVAPAGLSGVGDNPTNPGAHANYLATTAKCGLCHSVHRASVPGTKLLPTNDATCAGCHTGATAVTAKIVTWAPYSTTWTPDIDPGYVPTNATWYDDMQAGGAARTAAIAAILNPTYGGGGGPHNDSLLNLIEDGYWDGTGTAPLPSYNHGERYGCFTRRCHATNPHGAGTSSYKLFAAKLLFNDSPAEDDVTYGAAPGTSTYGGDDAVWDAYGATDASVLRFIGNNADVIREDPVNPGVLQLSDDGGTTWRAPLSGEEHALVAGLTCGRPSNFDEATGADECHAEAVYAVVNKGVTEFRNHATGVATATLVSDGTSVSGLYRTDNTGAEALGFGGNDNRDEKTGHVAGVFAAVPGDASYAGIAGCTSCHDQTDAANTVAGNFTFPHGQTATGATNLVLTDGVTSATGTRSRIWSGYSGAVGAAKIVTGGTAQKAYDGQCLKCHRDGGGNGIGLTH